MNMYFNYAEQNTKSGYLNENNALYYMWLFDKAKEYKSSKNNDLDAIIDELSLKLKKENEKLFSQYVSAVENTYSVTPYIYSKDATKKIVKLNPSDILSSMYSSSMSTFTSSMVTMFNQIPSNQDKIEEQYEIIAGKWPEKYNEVAIVLPNEHEISDMLLYGLGLRDLDELEELAISIKDSSVFLLASFSIVLKI